jgi:hypothetical protein
MMSAAIRRDDQLGIQDVIIGSTSLGVLYVTLIRGLPPFNSSVALLAVVVISMQGAVLGAQIFESKAGAQGLACTEKAKAFAVVVGIANTCLFYIFCQVFAIYP